MGADMAVHQRSNDWESGVKYAEDESSLSTFLKAALVQLARVGLMTVHTCCSPTTRGDLALTQQLADQALVTACYWLVGFPLATQAWWPTTPADWDMAVHAWGAVLLASGVLATAAAGRAHLLGLLAVTAVYAGLVQPVLSRWVVPTRDRGAAVLAHASGGALALAAELALGRRLAGVHELDARWGFPGHSVVAVSTAYLLVAVGSAALGLPVPGNAEPGLNTAALVAGGTALAASSAALVELMVVVVSRAQLDYWALLGVLQAAIAGVVTASSCADLYIPAVSRHTYMHFTGLQNLLTLPGAVVAERLACPPLTKANQIQSPSRTPRFSQIRIVPDDAAGRRVFSETSHFPHPCIPTLLHYHLISHSSALKISLLRATQISQPMREMKVNMEQHRNEGAGETGDPRENPPIKGIVRHDPHMRKSGDPAGIALVAGERANRSATEAPVPLKPLLLFLLGRATGAERLDCSPPIKVDRVHFPAGSLREVGIVLDDAAGLWVFSGMSRIPCPFIPALLRAHFASPSSALNTSLLRAAHISSLTPTLDTFQQRIDTFHITLINLTKSIFVN
ncbi:hypothetical protein PR048_027834 [Dryococelus australis]|uniref:Ammonium transporter AmtB-like domain-containing protein n=1 Tax=Dryococelus australis TaxID=614101 RepID=A0ABQ9GHN4_9NEOP|nr:hypothetical protein PR048_027834 [Dryococelus australis]